MVIMSNKFGLVNVDPNWELYSSLAFNLAELIKQKDRNYLMIVRYKIYSLLLRYLNNY